MAQRQEIVTYLNQFLEIEKFRDYCPNGLQVEGKADIKKIISGVTASQALLDEAVKQQADMILVHHGYFWRHEAYEIIGMKKKRIATLIKHDINLAAYHLPLDCHPTLGNNVLLAEKLNIAVSHRLDVESNLGLFCLGELPQALSAAAFADLIARTLNRKPLVEAVQDKLIKKIAWCTGGAQDYITLAAEHQCDAYLTGEVSERTIHIARENHLHFFAAGHHATERFGIQALGEHLAARFKLEHQFIDIENPV